MSDGRKKKNLKGASQTATEPSSTIGLLAEYDTPGALIAACVKVRDAGYTRWDSHAPFPVHGIDKAMGIRMTVLPLLVFCGGITGTGVAVLLQWWTNAIDYPWVISGKPLFSLPANIPIMFELTVLFSALTAFLGMLVLNKLPKFSQPLLNSERFRGMTTDRFFVLIEADDPSFDKKATATFLKSAGATSVEECVDENTRSAIPRVIILGGLVLVVITWVPLALIAAVRATPSSQPRVHLIPDMDFQPKYKPQNAISGRLEHAGGTFADGRAMRLPPTGSVARGELRDDPHLYKGKNPDGSFADGLPPALTKDLNWEVFMARGQGRFKIYCSVCHGLDGYGQGQIAQRAAKLEAGSQGWMPPASLHREDLRDVTQTPDGKIFDTITNGKLRAQANPDQPYPYTMGPYGAQISVEDRWAIVLYVRALQRSQQKPAE